MINRIFIVPLLFAIWIILIGIICQMTAVSNKNSYILQQQTIALIEKQAEEKENYLIELENALMRDAIRKRQNRNLIIVNNSLKAIIRGNPQTKHLIDK